MPNLVRASLLLPAVLAAAFFVALPAIATRAAETSQAAVTGDGQERTAGIDAAETGRLVEAAVNKRIRPLVREIRDLREEVRFHDILGGIGYIMGLAGLAFYFLGVRKRRDRAAGNAD
jgi:nickel transport protein